MMACFVVYCSVSAFPCYRVCLECAVSFKVTAICIRFLAMW